jgi:type III pantothenate kinase
MIMLLDNGNTRLKWAQSDGRSIGTGGKLTHGGDPAAALVDLNLEKAQQIWICHVTGPENEARLAHAIGQRLGTAPRFARSAAQLGGLHNAYAEPHRLGVDRWLCMLALWTRQHSAFCLAGAGTALTFDAVGADGRHQGGVIAPGLTSMRRAVLGATRFDVRGADERYDDSLGRDTESCVRQGALHACAGLVDRLAARHAGRRVITGGDAEILRPMLSGEWELRPQLVMEGLLVWGNSEESRA